MFALKQTAAGCDFRLPVCVAKVDLLLNAARIFSSLVSVGNDAAGLFVTGFLRTPLSVQVSSNKRVTPPHPFPPHCDTQHARQTFGYPW